MKKALFLILFAVFLLPFQNIAQISFVNGDNTFDFGQIPKGDSAMHKFEFRNTGNEDLNISGVKSDNPHLRFLWPRKAVKAGKKEMITVVYRSVDGDQTGSFDNEIQVAFSNTPNAYPLLRVKGAIVPARVAPSPKSFDTSRAIRIPLSNRARKPVKN